ncbi:MAG: HAD family phosphatase [Planctomycetales bacterium]|nr:HAD family phosphatase [Planctomycetales bacterium]
MKRNIEAVVFDLDGLIFNTEEIYQQVGRTILGRHGKLFEDELINEVMGRPPRAALQRMIDWHGLTISFEAFQADSDQAFLRLIEDDLQPMPGCLELFAALEAAAVPKAVATSSSKRLAHATLNRFAMIPRFEFVLTSDDVVNGKPDPEVYQTAAARLGIATADMLVLEDSQNGCRAAVAAGAVAVAVPSGHSHSHDFTGARLVADTLADRRIYELLGL